MQKCINEKKTFSDISRRDGLHFSPVENSTFENRPRGCDILCHLSYRGKFLCVYASVVEESARRICRWDVGQNPTARKVKVGFFQLGHIVCWCRNACIYLKATAVCLERGLRGQHEYCCKAERLLLLLETAVGCEDYMYAYLLSPNKNGKLLECRLGGKYRANEETRWGGYGWCDSRLDGGLAVEADDTS